MGKAEEKVILSLIFLEAVALAATASLYEPVKTVCPMGGPSDRLVINSQTEYDWQIYNDYYKLDLIGVLKARGRLKAKLSKNLEAKLSKERRKRPGLLELEYLAAADEKLASTLNSIKKPTMLLAELKKCAYPVFNWEKEALVVATHRLTGCQFNSERIVNRDDKDKTVTVTVFMNAYGKCEMTGLVTSWLRIFRPRGYRVKLVVQPREGRPLTLAPKQST